VLLDYYTAETLTKLGIDIADAESGKVKHKPAVQGVVPADVQDVLSPRGIDGGTPAPNTAPAAPPPNNTEPHQ